MSSAIVKQTSKPAWNGMFQKVGHDMDRIVTACLDAKDLNVLAVCKRWRDNPRLIELKNRCIVEWRKDQAAIAAGCDELLVQFLRRNHICLWDLPLQAHHDSPLPDDKIDMPIINNTSCSIAKVYSLERDRMGLIFALQSKKKRGILADPLEFVRHLEEFARKSPPLLSPENIEPGTNIEPPLVYMMPVSHLVRFTARRTARYEAPIYLRASVALDAIAPLLSDTHPEIGLANRVTHVLPENSPPIPDAIPLVPPRPVGSTTFTKNKLIAILLGLCLVGLIRHLWNLSRE